MIRAENVVKTFEQVRALDGLNMHVSEGSVYGLVGPNGAGKTTLIRQLVGIDHPDSGTILVGDSPVFEQPEIKAKIAYIPDDFYALPQASIREMAFFYAGLYPKFDRSRFRKLSDLFELDPKAQIRRMSRGMQKQAAFWLALSCRPEILILDEPVDGLDPVMRRKIWQCILDEVAASGTTVLVSSHNLRELEDVCDHVGIMDHGRMLLEKSLDELQEGICKIQLVLPEGVSLPDSIAPLHRESTGRVQMLIMHGSQAEITEKLNTLHPVLMDVLPLTLEEIFIYELGGADHEMRKILL